MPYDDIAVPPAVLETFDSVPSFEAVPSTGTLTVDGVLSIDGANLGASFVGQRLQTQSVKTEIFDRVFDLPLVPLQLAVHPPGANLALSENAKPGTKVLMGIGPTGDSQGNSLGRGSIAILFEDEVCQIGFRIDIQGARTFNTGFEGPGSVDVSFFSETGERIDVRSAYERGELALGFGVQNAAQGGIKGVLIQNLDRQGTYIDDLKYLSDCEPKLS
ncbi:MAG: hypothetical protein JNK34_03190 [Tabrizicola sp.]|nr:hypothetical protein [Tabrizicola sp.]